MLGRYWFYWSTLWRDSNVPILYGSNILPVSAHHQFRTLVFAAGCLLDHFCFCIYPLSAFNIQLSHPTMTPNTNHLNAWITGIGMAGFLARMTTTIRPFSSTAIFTLKMLKNIWSCNIGLNCMPNFQYINESHGNNDLVYLFTVWSKFGFVVCIFDLMARSPTDVVSASQISATVPTTRNRFGLKARPFACFVTTYMPMIKQDTC